MVPKTFYSTIFHFPIIIAVLEKIKGSRTRSKQANKQTDQIYLLKSNTSTSNNTRKAPTRSPIRTKWTKKWPLTPCETRMLPSPGWISITFISPSWINLEGTWSLLNTSIGEMSNLGPKGTNLGIFMISFQYDLVFQ